MEDPRTPRSFSEHLLEYLRDPSLWPVMLVSLAIFVTLGATILLVALRSRNRFVLLGLIALIGITIDAVVREIRARGPGPTCALAAVLWGLSALAAAAAVASGIY